MTAVSRYVRGGVKAVTPFILKKGYKITLTYAGRPYEFFVSRETLKRGGWSVFEVSTGLRCAWGDTRTRALEMLFSRMKRIDEIMVKADSDPTYTVAISKKEMAEFQKTLAENALK